ncbi:GUN4 domain-containing protein [Prochlorococcus marinus]|uniref:GUN4 domain-containing protein n=1 Tax=Prochlorococcus marinus TaxID=1219 RepID=UPI0022B5CEA4|nr:GUN4 domain-containing protein [Prochlorococcus marinus]
MTEEKTHPNKESIEEFLESFKMASERKRHGLLNGLEDRVDELLGLGARLMTGFDPGVYEWPPGFILQLIHKTDQNFIKNNLDCDDLSWFNAPSDVGFDYSPLQRYLLNECYEDADRFTSSKLRELAGEKAVKRGYVYFSEVESIPSIDLSTLDKLWVVYSRGKFGFTVQAKILDSLGGRYDKLWPRIGWKNDGIWTRYPKAFNWSIDAPNGHMPLVNQLRGVRLMDALLNHQGIKAKT